MGIISYLKKEAHNFYKDMEASNHDLMFVFLQINNKINSLSKSDWLNFITYLKDKYGKKISIVLAGGEPLLSPYLSEITSLLAQKRFRWGIETNGYLLNAEKLEMLLENKITNISIALHGNEEQHNQIVGSDDAYAKTIEAIELVNDSVLKYKEIVTFVTPLIISNLNEMAKLMKKLGVRIWKLIPATKNNINGEEDLSLNFDDAQKLVAWLESRRSHYSKLGLDINMGETGWLPYKTDKAVRERLFLCRTGISHAAILSDGTISGAIGLHKSYSQGNIRNDDFDTVWKKKFEVFRNRKWLKNTYCNKCRYIADCRGSSFEYWKPEAEKPIFCFMQKL